VSDGDRLAMEPTLEEALRAAFGGAAGHEAGADHLWPAAELDRARQSLSAAEAALQSGDWARFGAAMQELKSLLAPAAQDGP
jgi:uncharacterized membrane protein (UPF0182 family)